jgi:hypothetical protein
MILHRIIRLLCLAGATIAPTLAAFLCRFVLRIVSNHLIPHSEIAKMPLLTQVWVAGVVDGTFPLVPIGLLLSVLIAAAGFYVLSTKRLSRETITTAFAFVCCVGYTAAVLSLGSTMMALVLPFLPTVTK